MATAKVETDPPTNASSDALVSPQGKRQKNLILANLSYVILGPTHSRTPVPLGSLRTRAFIRTTRYILVFVFHRLIRYGKYALMGALGAGLLGTFGSVAGVLIAPGLVSGMGIGLAAAIVKVRFRFHSHAVQDEVLRCGSDPTFSFCDQFTWKHRGDHFQMALQNAGEGDPKADEEADAKEDRDAARSGSGRRRRR
jgi:hypothetical protein